MLHVDIDTYGPIWNGQFERTMRVITNDTEKDAGREAYSEIELRFGQVFRYADSAPTGHAAASVDVHPVAGDIEVDMGRLIYGPWLEGVGSRNRTTRFKGYFTFRLIAQKMRGEMERIAQKVYDRHKGGLGG